MNSVKPTTRLPLLLPVLATGAVLTLAPVLTPAATAVTAAAAVTATAAVTGVGVGALAAAGVGVGALATAAVTGADSIDTAGAVAVGAVAEGAGATGGGFCSRNALILEFTVGLTVSLLSVLDGLTVFSMIVCTEPVFFSLD